MHNHQSKFTNGQLVNVVRGGFRLHRVMISTVTFFTPHAGNGILGSNASVPQDQECGVKYTVAEPLSPTTYRDTEVWSWMLELA